MTIVPTSRLAALVALAGAGALGLVLAPAAWPFVAVADVLLVLAALADLLLAPRPRLVEVRRKVTSRGLVLHPQLVTLVVRNRSARHLRVRLRDTAPGDESAPELRVSVDGGEEAIARYDFTPRRRGRCRFGDIHLRFASPGGLWDLGRVEPAAETLDVYPDASLLEHYKLLALADRTDSDVRTIRRLGASAEFESLRDYAFGDDTRKIDWKASARRARLILRQERAERNQTVLVLIDSGRLMTAEEQGTSKLDLAINAALLLAHVALSRGDRVGVCAFSDKVHFWLAPRNGGSQGRLIADALFDLQGDFRESDHARALQLLANRHPKRSLVVTLTDFVDATTAADMVTHLGQAARRHVVLLAALQDRFLRTMATRPAVAVKDGYRRAAALELLRDRREVLEQIRHRGGMVLDATPADLSPRLLNKYLEIALRGMV